MKKIYLILLIPLFLLSNLNIERVNSVLCAIRLNDKALSYYTSDKSFFLKLKTLKSKSSKDADIIIFPKEKSGEKMTILDNYESLKEIKNSIGAIYVKKGRTQIIFVEERLKENGLKLPNQYDKYIIKECYIKEICFLN